MAGQPIDWIALKKTLLIQLNEPLTWEELKAEVKINPIYSVKYGWIFPSTVKDEPYAQIWFFTSKGFAHTELFYHDTFYRRPPEGEEGRKMFIWDRCAICDRIIPVGELCYGIKNWKGDPEGGRTICKNCIAPENVDSIAPAERVGEHGGKATETADRREVNG